MQLKECFRATIKLSPALDIGPVPTGIRRVIPIIGGRFEGERFKGDVLPIGADWNLVQPNGIVYLSARYVIRTDDGALISILNEGWARTDNDVMADIMADRPICTDGWYAKTHPRFEAADSRYHWMNDTVFVCEMLPPPSADTVLLVFYEVV